jgi:hypothetical protein
MDPARVQPGRRLEGVCGLSRRCAGLGIHALVVLRCGLAGLDKTSFASVPAPSQSVPIPTCSSTLRRATSLWMMQISRSPALQRCLRKPPRIPLTTPSLRPPVAMTSCWQLGLAMLPRWSRPARQVPPDCVKVSLLVCMYVELVLCLMAFRSCTSMTFHPKSLMHWFLVVCELDLT